MVIITDLPDSPEVQEVMPEKPASKDQLLNLYAQHRHAMEALPDKLLPCAMLELGQLSAALRFHHNVCDSELLYAVEVRS
jgi:hypothetical protein